MSRTSEWRKGKELKLEPAPCAETLFRTMFAVMMSCEAGEELMQMQSCCQWARAGRKIPADVWLRGHGPHME